MKLLKHQLILGLLAMQFASCDDTYQSSIPNWPVHLEINTSTAPYTIFINSSLKCIPYKPINEADLVGYGGIIICTGFDGTYAAFDMACPYEADRNIRVYPPKDGDYIGQVTCEKCGSVFELGYGIGNPSSGPAKETLKRYKANLSGYTLYITR